MREVSKDEFYKVLGPLDAIGELSAKYPYTHTFHLRGAPRVVIAKIEPVLRTPEAGPTELGELHDDHYYVTP